MIMYFCAKSSDFASLYIFTIEFLNYSDSEVFFGLFFLLLKIFYYLRLI